MEGPGGLGHAQHQSSSHFTLLQTGSPQSLAGAPTFVLQKFLSAVFKQNHPFSVNVRLMCSTLMEGGALLDDPPAVIQPSAQVVNRSLRASSRHKNCRFSLTFTSFRRHVRSFDIYPTIIFDCRPRGSCMLHPDKPHTHTEG